MLEVDIILNGGGHGFKKVIQRIAIWNVSELSEVSDYEYAISWPIPMGETGELPTGRQIAGNEELCEFRGEVKGHNRLESSPLSLLRKVLDSGQGE